MRRTVFDHLEIGVLFLSMDSDDATVCGCPHHSVYLVYLTVSESVLVMLMIVGCFVD